MDALPWRVVDEVPCPEVALGEHRFDIRRRAIVVGVLDTPLDELGGGAEALVIAGAEAIDVATAVSLEQLGDAIGAICAGVRVPVIVTTSSAAALQVAIEAGAVAGNDDSGFADPDYLAVAAAGGASVIATHTAVGEQGPAVDAVCGFLRERAERAVEAGIPPERVVLDAGVDRAVAVRALDRVVGLGWPVSFSASGGTAHATRALAVALGARLLRSRDVRSARRTAAVMAAILQARTAS